jgi:hypothetical protein
MVVSISRQALLDFDVLYKCPFECWDKLATLLLKAIHWSKRPTDASKVHALGSVAVAGIDGNQATLQESEMEKPMIVA